MKEWIIKSLVAVVISQLMKKAPELLIEAIDKALDWIEDKVASTENQLDDSLLPVCAMLRETLNIPDNDEPAPSE